MPLPAMQTHEQGQWDPNQEKTQIFELGRPVGPFLNMIQKIRKFISSVHIFLFRIH